ncbi:MAG: hypothetical protein IPJ94_28070 [Chloroflexi bacterium]|nr:hypothetical protein [Chloroflexota bacterium]
MRTAVSSAGMGLRHNCRASRRRAAWRWAAVSGSSSWGKSALAVMRAWVARRPYTSCGSRAGKGLGWKAGGGVQETAVLGQMVGKTGVKAAKARQCAGMGGPRTVPQPGTVLPPQRQKRLAQVLHVGGVGQDKEQVDV